MRNAVVVGLGIGLAHVAGYLESENARLYGVSDLDPRRTDHVGGTFDMGNMLVIKPLFDQRILPLKWEELGVKVFKDIDEVLEDDNVDIISICTPDYLHPEHLEKALKKGKNVLLEKPLAIDLETSRHVEKIARDLNGNVGLDYEFRLMDPILEMKRAVDNGELGEFKAFSLYHFRTPFKRDKWNQWIQRKECSGGLIVQETCHWLDLARYITGKEISSVHCVTNGDVHCDFDYEDIAYINGSYDDGTIFQISHALTGFDFSLQLTLHGTRKVMWCNFKDNERSSLDAFGTDYIAVLSKGAVNGGFEDAEVHTYGPEALEPFNIRKMVIQYCRELDEGNPHVACIEDGARSLEAALACLESAKTGNVVRLSDFIGALNA